MMKLVYFNARGVVENARIMMKIGGIAFEDHRLPLKPKEGGGFETAEFSAMKTTGECVVNMDRVPLLIVDGVVIGQSKAIERFVAKKANMLGSSEVEAAQIDCITEHIRDIKDKYNKIKALPPAEKEEGLKKWFATELGEWLIKLEKSFPAGHSSGYSVGSVTSYADIAIWSFLTEYFDNNVSVSYESCEGIKAILATVSSIESMKAYLAERPVTGF